MGKCGTPVDYDPRVADPINHDPFASEIMQKKGFSISIPSGWVEIPKDTIEVFEKELNKAAPNHPAQHYDYGFQLKSSKKWLEYPYILVQVKNTGRIPESQLKKIESYSVQDSLKKNNEKYNALMTEMREVGKTVYNEKTQMIWMQFESNVANIGQVSGIVGMIPTEGLIIVTGSSRREKYSIYKPFFQSVAASVTRTLACI